MNSLLLLCAVTTIAIVPVSNWECPNVGTKLVPSKISVGPYQECGSGISLQVQGVTLRDTQSRCPTFAIYEPPHHVLVAKPGRQVQAAGANSILHHTFRCTNRWFLGWIPIPVGSSCAISDTKKVGTLPVYFELPCAMRAQREPLGRGTLPAGR